MTPVWKHEIKNCAITEQFDILVLHVGHHQHTLFCLVFRNVFTLLPPEPIPHLHSGADALGDLVSELAGGGVRLGQQERIRQRAVLRLHDLRVEKREREGEGGEGNGERRRGEREAEATGIFRHSRPDVPEHSPPNLLDTCARRTLVKFQR